MNLLSDDEFLGGSASGGSTLLNDDQFMGGATKAEKPAAERSAAPTGDFKGLVEPGNIDLAKRPVVKNDDGSVSTVRSMSFEQDGKEILIPTVSPDGKILSDEDAIKLYQKTGQHLGVFDNADDATAYAKALHGAQEDFYTGKPKSSGVLSDDEFLGGKPATGAASGDFIDQVKKGFISGLVDQNPQMVGNAMDAIAELSDGPSPGDLVGRMVPAKPGGKVRPMEESPQRLRDLAAQVKEWGSQGADTRRPNVPSVTSIRTDSLANMIGDAADYAGYLIGSGAGTSAPSLAVGVAGAAVTKSPLGFIASAAGPSYVQNLGDTYGALLENEGVKKALADGKITRKQVASIAAGAAIPMAALDAASLEGVIGLNATGLKQNIVKRIIQRVGVGALTEGTTEGIQQVVQEAAIDAAGGDKTLAQQAVSVIDNAIGGALAGGAMGAGASPAAGSQAQEQDAAPVDQTTNIPQGAASADTLFGQESADGPPPSSADTAAGGPPPPPAASPEVDRPNSPRLTAEDRASPLPNNLIDDGKAIFEAALSGGKKQPTTAEDVAPLDGQIITPAQQRDAAKRVADIAGEFGTPASRTAMPALEHTIDGVATGAETPSAPAAAPVRALSDREFIGGISPIDDAAHVAATSPLNDRSEPTQAMKEAGNYKKGKVRIADLDISIENPKGSVRSGTSPGGSTWETTLPAHYGYITGVAARSPDKEHVDVYVGEDHQSPNAYIINQNDPQTGKFDEAKIILGAKDSAAAITLYDQGFSDGSGPQRRASAIEMPVADLKEYLNTHGFKLPARPSPSAGRVAVELPTARSESATPDVSASSIQGVAQPAGQVSEPKQSVLPQLRGAGDQAAPVNDELPVVSRDSGGKADAAAPVGSEGQRRPLRAGQPSVGNEERAGAKPAEKPSDNGQRRDKVDGGVGGDSKSGAVDDSLPALKGDVGRGGRDDAGAVPRKSEPVAQSALKEKIQAKREATKAAQPEPAKVEEKAPAKPEPKETATLAKDFTEADIPAFLKKDREKAALRTDERAKLNAAENPEVRPTDAFKEQAQTIGTRLRAELDRLGLKDIGLRISEDLGLMVEGKFHAADGSYFQKLITISLDADNPDAVLNHEAIHALHDVGAFSPAEWAILERKSRKEWRDKYEIGDTYGSFSDSVQTEEGIAHAYADWRDGRSMDGIIAKAFKKIRSVIQAIGKAFGKDFRSAEDVFAQVASGEVGNRSLSESKGGEEKFKLQDPQTAEDRQKTMQGFIARGQPLDRALRLPFEFLGGVDAKGRWKPGLYVTDKAAKIITTAKIDPEGRFGWLAGPVEAARAGLVDRYGLSPEYIERDRQRHMDERAITMRGAEVLKTLADQNVGPNEARVLQAILTGEAVTDKDMQGLAAPIRQAIDELGQEAVTLGLISAESFERNRGSYLHRVYAKHESEQNNLQKLVSQIMGSKRKKILGDTLKGRGLFWEVGRDALLRHSSSAQAMRKADSQIGGIEKRIETLASRKDVLEGELKTLGREMAAHMGRRMDVADRATIKKMVGESRTTKPSSFQKGQVLEQAVALNRLRDRIEQREAALDKIDGEIAAAQQRIDELSDHLISQSENLSVTKDSKFVVLDKTVDKGDGKPSVAQRVYLPADEQIPARFSGPEWTNRGTWEARQIGKGKVTLWRDYSQAERSKMGEILDARYTIGKTYIHMAHDLAVGRFYKDIAENEDWATSSEPAAKWVEADQRSRLVNDRETAWVKVPDTTISNTGGKKRWGALSGKWVRSEIWRDLNEIDIMNRPSTWRMLLSQWKLNKTSRSPVTHMNNVMSNLMLMDMNDVRMQDLQAGLRSFVKKDKHWQDANEHGIFGADMMTQEIRDNVLKPILEEMEKQGQDGTQNSFLARAGILGKFADRLWSLAKTADRKMIDLYRIEDDVFRLASYRAGVARGESAEHAAAAAREQFFDYDIRAPWVNAARNSLLPFISYTYRAVPLIARAMATKPWKLAKYAMVAYALNALAYAWDDDADEDKERASLRDEEQGKTWLRTYRMMRMPWRNADGLPVFLDARRWIPGGDVFDTNQGSSALPIPAPLQFGGPLMLAFELALNKSSFTGDPITNDLTDTWFDKSGKVGDYLWKSWMPSAAWVPNSWYWTKIENAAKGATDIKGRPYGLPEAVASSFGIKLKPQDVETGIFWQYKDMKDVEQALRAEARTLARQRDRGLISQKAFDSGMQALLDKRDVLIEHVKELQRATRKK